MNIDRGFHSEGAHLIQRLVAVSLVTLGAIAVGRCSMPDRTPASVPVEVQAADYTYPDIKRETVTVVIPSGAYPQQLLNGCGIVDAESAQKVFDHTPLQLGDTFEVTGIDTQSPACPTVEQMYKRYEGCTWEGTVLNRNPFEIGEEYHLYDGAHALGIARLQLGDTTTPVQQLFAAHWNETVEMPHCDEVPR